MKYGKKQVLDHMSFAVEKGKKIAIVGDSGCGKSTLARIIINLLSPTSGEVLIDGRPVKKLKRHEKAKRIQMVFQHPINSFNPKKKIGSQLEEASRLNGLPYNASGYLNEFGLKDDLLDRYPFQISGGEAQRLSIIRSISLKPQILILDEPTSMLDVSTQAEVFHYLLNYQRANDITLVLISHDIELVSRVCDEIIIINEGKISEMGKANDIMEKPKTAYTRELIEKFKFFDE